MADAVLSIAVFPYDGKNPYQELFYREFLSRGDRIVFLRPRTIWRLLPSLVRARLNGCTVLHLHWLYPFGHGRRRCRALRYVYFRVFLVAAQLLRYTVVWTAHNVLPHDQIFRDDAAARRALVRACDLVVVHAESALSELSELGVVVARSVVVPHASYSSVYPDRVPRSVARRKLGIEPDAFVYLFLGSIRSYKGIDELFAAYRRVRGPHVQLIVAGHCDEDRLRELLKAQATADDVTWVDGFVSHDEVPVFFAAADVAVLPFRRVSSSGSALLALSFGVPIIAPPQGSLALIPAGAMYPYDGTVAGLVAAMDEAHRDPGQTGRAAQARAFAEVLTWEGAAEAVRSAILSIKPAVRNEEARQWCKPV